MISELPPLDLSFSVPVVSHKVYIVKGPSGWPEVMRRDKLDAELTQFLRPLTVDDVLGIFTAARTLTRTPADWWTVTGFLARTMSLPGPKSVPHTVAIGFWGRYVLHTLGDDE